jgi:raffinose/stachyose/melibiose transport system substrate-binding protein
MPVRADTAWVLFYNKKMLGQLGLEAPKTWDELLNVVKTARKKGITPISLGGKDRWPGDLTYNTFVVREQVDAYTKALNGEMLFTDKPFVDAADKIRELVKEKAFQEGFLGAGYIDSRDLFSGGKSVMFISGSWDLVTLSEALKDDLGYIIFPKTGNEVYSAQMGDRSTAPYGLFVNPKSPQQAKAKEFIIRYSLRLNDEFAKQGMPPYAQTDVKPAAVNPNVTQFLDDMKTTKQINTFWFATVPAQNGEEYRDLNQQLYTGQLSSKDYVAQMEKILRKK